jgi:prolyl oligopeptidase PreP (S9A serine peptidase family)
MAHDHHIVLLTASDAQCVPFHCKHFHVKLTGTKHNVLFRVTSNRGQKRNAENGTSVTREVVLQGPKTENHNSNRRLSQ